MNCIPILALLLVSATSTLARAQIALPLYTDYEEPPYATAQPDNLTSQLAAYLTTASKGAYRFTAVQVPRRRLDALVATPDWKGVIAWGNPNFFSNLPGGSLLWTSSYMKDTDLVVSLRSKPVNYSGPQSVTGLRVGAIRGWQLNDLDQAIRSGLIRREYAPTGIANLKKLRAGRVDFILLQGSSMPYYRREFPDLDDWIYISPTPRREFTRHFAVAPLEGKLYEFLQSTASTMPADLFIK
ncbi:hypothetical protein [Chitinilyticum litopenaei]|uniref:hypothetical protein n=1 Tax=Chitinilyticum litopenaei TaxID=1121276 RepID=UPI0004107AF5|nr:hypothetical protein [Chitinilyticum litopenaei]